MGGYSTKRPRRPGSLGFTADVGSGGDAFVVDLMGVRSDVLVDVMPGMTLDVGIENRPGVMSAVCRFDGRVVGALAAFRGLAQLLADLLAGERYLAFVLEVTPARCAVRVERAA